MKRKLLATCAAVTMTVGLAVTGWTTNQAGAANTPINGAAFTTVNETADGTGHCQNGNPTVNCNIYDGKQYVWMNGGPSTAYVGDGSYFFAVLVPGGQADPNDGASKNLSDDFDAYTNRTFSVSGGTVAYGGGHDSDGNKIRLADYADTSNPGGVYIMAICSLADGYPVNPSDCKYDAFKVKAGEQPPSTPAADPTITKDAAGAYDTSWTWGIGKSVDKTLVKQVGGSATFKYTVSVTHDAGTNSKYRVSGTIDVENPNFDDTFTTVPITVDSISDVLSDNTVCTVDTSGGLTLTAFDNYFKYSCSLSGAPASLLSNTAEVTWSDAVLSNDTQLAAGTANFTFTPVSFSRATEIDDCVNVTDSYAATLGTVCQSDASPTAFTYSRTVPVPAYGCVSYGNTATFTADTTGAYGTASQSVRVCGPAKTGALTIGFWQNKNGQGIITGQAKTGTCPSATWLRQFAPFANLSATATCPQVATYVYNVIKAANASGAAMNAMLKAQMLATALDVYFSDPALGGNKIGAPAPIGGVGIDLTKVCKTIDGSGGSGTCGGSYENVGGAFGGATSLTVVQMLTYAAGQSDSGGSAWYGQVKSTQGLAKDAFDAINNQVAFGA